MTTMILLLALLAVLAVTIRTVRQDRPRSAPRSHVSDTRFLPPVAHL